MATPVDRGALDSAIGAVNRRLDAHAGAVELVNVDAEGRLLLRWLGMCTGCPYRPLTLSATVRPMLTSVAGVTTVDAEGTRISAEAEARLIDLFETVEPPRLHRTH